MHLWPRQLPQAATGVITGTKEPPMNNVSFVPAITTHYLVYKLCLQGFLYFLLCSLCTYTIARAQDENQEYPEYLEEGRTFAIQNVSLVITYTTMAVAVVMMASFLWIALNFGTSRSGYSGYGSDDYYSRRKRSSGLFGKILSITS